MKRTAALIAILALAAPAAAFANHGNGGGNSGQCTGPQADRPASCQSQGGPGDQP